MNKRATLLLIAILTVTNLLMVNFAPASGYNPPSIPEFTAKLADNSYDVPPTKTSTANP